MEKESPGNNNFIFDFAPSTLPYLSLSPLPPQEMLGPSFFLALCPLSTYPPDWDGWSFPEQTQLRDGGGMFDEREGPGREVGKRRGRGREIEVDIDDDDDYSD